MVSFYVRYFLRPVMIVTFKKQNCSRFWNLGFEELFKHASITIVKDICRVAVLAHVLLIYRETAPNDDFRCIKICLDT